MYILGISCCYHDSSAALLKDGKIVAAAEEERFTRKKHDTAFPVNAINYCLKSQKISIDQIKYVGFYEKPFIKFERILYQHLQMFPWSLKTFLNSMPSWINEKLRVIRALRKKIKYKGDVLFVEHHLAHAASSFFPSPFEKAAILTIDGVGEWTTTAFGVGKKNSIELKKQIQFPHSLGLLYSTITAYLGFSVNNSEYKVMGLAPYGDMNKKTNPYYKKLKKVIDVKPDGSFRLNMRYFRYHYLDRMPSKKLEKLLNGPTAKKDARMTSRHKDIAAALQLITEEVILKILSHIHEKTGRKNLVLAGGVALNSVLNGKILKNTPFERIWIQPNASDGGTSLGVALFIYHNVLGRENRARQKHASLGPEFSTAQIKAFLKKRKIKHARFSSSRQLIKKTARLILDNQVVGWFQGRMEWGPRALGNRSILANPANPKAKALLNKKVKHREKFRPFAPVVPQDDASRYFDCDQPIPEPADFMLMVYPVKKKWREKIPSVTHVDSSGRLQTIRRFQNPLYYDLIKEFGRLSGIPVLINTSFNIRGEPIVCSPSHAYKCMMGTGIDYLVMDKFLIRRLANPRHLWNSEKYAKD
ncbi:MAG: carbamoyltransferase [Patescibacteria group bacterium]